ncbi:replication/maintenance protein RepL [Streptococcus ovis]|uniref:replication/maintenance protein RepL n=1 Tax=Streptococcus ovis TaxID=82806 RepID=UPI0003730A78|nr:replication/maintenance protein RepL [Streptococcus ovis]
MESDKQIKNKLSKEKKIESLGNHKKVKVEFVQKQHAITEKSVPVFSRECPGEKKFLECYYDLLAASMGYQEKGAGIVLQHLQNNVKEGNIVIVTLKKLAEEAGTSITWIKRTFDRLVLDGYVSNVALGVWEVTSEFLELTHKPDQQTQIVFDFIQVPDQLEAIDDKGEVNPEMADINIDDLA